MAAPIEPTEALNLWQLAIIAAQFVLNLLVAIVAGAVAYGRSNQSVTGRIEAAKLETERLVDEKTDEAMRQSGEAVSAIRQKITEIELWGRDHYVRRDTFELVMSEMRDSTRRFEDKIDKQLDNINKKLDALVSR